MERKKQVAILGSTGSIGTQALEVCEAHADKFEIDLLTANNNAHLLVKQALKFKPNTVVIANEEKYQFVKDALANEPIKVYAGEKSITQAVESDNIDIVLTAMVGYAGLLPTIQAIKTGKNIALANKETLVVAGELIAELVAENQVNIFPVDSEHSAIFQCMVGEVHNPIEKIYLTASGGPFRGKSHDFLKTVTKYDALKHPNWEMGAKITIDSATLMNKGLEVIEARWLFDLQPEQIDIIVHPQSIVHSIVQFEDGSMKAQMGLPDMKLPILFALAFPHRLRSDFKRFNFMDYPNLSFEAPDRKQFKCLDLAYTALKKGGNLPCILNAANEIAVDAFLHDKVRFLDIPQIIENTVMKSTFKQQITIEDLIETDKEARKVAQIFIKKLQ